MVPHDPKKDDPRSPWRDWLALSNLVATVARTVIDFMLLIR